MIEYFAPGEVLEASREDELYPETAALLRACRASPYVEVRELRCEASGMSRTEYIVIDAGMAPLTLGILVEFVARNALR